MDEDPEVPNEIIPSPPHCIIDDTPIQKQMDKNKESLRVKLMLRRPISQLIDQGILPSPKTPIAFFEQRQKLERAKMGDILKAKIQRRPQKEELIQQHILEDNGNVDPSLAERHRQLKKAKLADSLNDQISHRPGPLELIEENILHTDLAFEKAVKEGQIQFKKTCEGENKKHVARMFTEDIFEEDSTSDDTSSPQNDINLMSPISSGLMSEVQNSVASFSPSLASSSSLSPLSSVSSPANFSSLSQISTTSNITNKSRKKLKATKGQPKMRTIKFHEYKGPPSVQKKEYSQPVTQESSYDLLLKQQQLFLQWQLELQHKIILPANKSGIDTNLPNVIAVNPPLVHLTTRNSNHATATSDCTRNVQKLENMKVLDLKAELKKRNLPVSGCKPQLIERLKPFSNYSSISHVCISKEDACTSSPAVISMDVDFEPEVTMDTLDSSHVSQISNKICFEESADAITNVEMIDSSDVIKQQELQIAQLQQEVEESKRQLEHLKRFIQTSATCQSDSLRSQKLILQQHLQNKIQTQQLQAQIQHLQTLQNLQQQEKFSLSSDIKLDNLLQQMKTNGHSIPTSVTIPVGAHQINSSSWDKPPISYEEAIKQSKINHQNCVLKKQTMKSQSIDDALEILIHSGGEKQYSYLKSSPAELLPPDLLTSADVESQSLVPSIPKVSTPCHANLSSSVLHTPPSEFMHSLDNINEEQKPLIKIENDNLFIDSFDFPFIDYDKTGENDLISCLPCDIRDPLLISCQEPLDLYGLEDAEFHCNEGSQSWI